MIASILFGGVAALVAAFATAIWMDADWMSRDW
jgi:hypothetical protein